MCSITILSRFLKPLLGLIVSLIDDICVFLCEKTKKSLGVSKREVKIPWKIESILMLLIISQLTGEEAAHTDVTFEVILLQ